MHTTTTGWEDTAHYSTHIHTSKMMTAVIFQMQGRVEIHLHVKMS